MPTDQGAADGGSAGQEARLARASGAVGAGILLSRLAGLLREKLLAYHLGTGLAAEAFRAALRIPNLLQNLLGDGVLTGAFVPTYARMLRDEREEAAGRLAGAVASLLILITGALVVIGVLAAGPITRLLTPGFPAGSAKYELTVTLVRVLTPSLGFLVLSAWCLGILNAHRWFFRAYVAPVLWNAAIIVAVTVGAMLGRSDGDLARAVALGALIGAALQFLSQLPAVLRSTRGLRFGLRGDVAGLREVLQASSGVIAGRGIVQLSAYLDLAIASLLAAGAVAALGYAQVLYLLPVSLFGMSVAAAALPDLATVPVAERARIVTDLDRGMARIAAFVIPTSAAYLVLGDAIVGVLFGGGAFGDLAIRQVAVILAAYAIGLLATTQSRLLQSALYGLDDTRTPARVAAIRVGVATSIGIALMLVLDAYRWEAGGPVRVGPFGFSDEAARAAIGSLHRLGAAGLALGASAGAWTEWFLLRRAVARTTGTRPPRAGASRAVLASVAILIGAPIGSALTARLSIPLADLPIAVSGIVTLLPALLLFAVAAAALDLEDLPFVARARRAGGLSRSGRRTR
jgi:putative peptidoglycan lipid II flippase